MASASEIPPARAAEILDDLTAIVARACAKISTLSPGELLPRMKADRSPVTVADEASEMLIAQGVARLLPDVPVVSEESA
ncbi:MAG: 3'(2'),5'-bisphosphate nucleotidase CysQ, partial [Pseudolabrys sp.]